MKKISQFSASGINESNAVPFDSAEEAWFWFIIAQQARNDGAKFVAGQGIYPRPCEPVDILKVLDGLYRQRRLIRDHLMVLRHYGRRGMAPDRFRTKEMRAHKLWKEALGRLSSILERKGIVVIRPVHDNHFPHPNWHAEAALYEQMEA